MKKVFYIFILIFCFTKHSSLQAQSPVEAVYDPFANINLAIEKGLEVESKIIKTKNLHEDIKTAKKLKNFLEVTKKNISLLKKASSSIKKLSCYKRIVKKESSIITNIQKYYNEIKKFKYLDISYKNFVKDIYAQIISDSNKIISYTGNILTDDKFNMYDNNRINILEKKEKELQFLLSVVTQTYEKFRRENDIQKKRAIKLNRIKQKYNK